MNAKSDRIANAEIGEIEITPEMIEAGIDALVESDPRYVRRSVIVANIFKAMVDARSKDNA